MKAAKPLNTNVFLANAVHLIRHFGAAELVTLDTAASRLYVPEVPRNKVQRQATQAEMRRIYNKTKGQPFVLEMPPGNLDAGPLFVWGSLWLFAGAPQKGERPTWKAASGGYIATSTDCTPGRCLMRVRPEVAEFRHSTSPSGRGTRNAALAA